MIPFDRDGYTIPVATKTKHYLVTIIDGNGQAIASIHRYDNPGIVTTEVKVVEL